MPGLDPDLLRSFARRYLLRSFARRSYTLEADDPEAVAYAEQLAFEGWLADGSPVEGLSTADANLLAQRPLTIRQSALRENVSERTIYRWARSGELGAHRAGRKWLVEPAALDRRRIEAAKPKPAAPLRRHRARKRPVSPSKTEWWPS